MVDDFPTVFTLEDAARLLLTSPDTLRTELEAGRLRGFRVGNDWRITKLALLEVIGEKPSPEYDVPNRKPTHSLGETEMSSIDWKEIPTFEYTWPKNANDPESSTGTFKRAFGASIMVANQIVPVQ